MNKIHCVKKPFRLWVKRIAFLIFPLLLTGCGSFSPSQDPVLALEGVHTFATTALSFSPDDTRLASAGWRGEIKIWSIPDGKLLTSLSGHTVPVWGLAWAGDDTLISAAEDGRLLVWDLKQRAIIAYADELSEVVAMDYSAETNRIYTLHKNGRLRAFEYPSLKVVATRLQADAEGLALALSKDGSHVAASFDGRRVVLLDGDLTNIRELERPPRDITSMRFAPDGQQLAGGAWFDIHYWDVRSGVLRVQKSGHFGQIASLDYTPDYRIVTLGRNTDAQLLLSDSRTGRLERRLAPHQLCGWVVRVSHNGRYVASGSEDESVRVFDLHAPYLPTLAK
ncbi:MAG: hypothetical protein BMS9Abin15_0647 [Gammaproteobacteria bacterium]|nr:MAG: hypothetical protein BMS9Abin15_0647 [Gammaproteobacteria bacterium]